MTPNAMDDSYRIALKQELVRTVTHQSVPSRSPSRRLWAGIGAFTGVGVLVGVGVAAAGFLAIPGSDVTTVLSESQNHNFSGSADIPVPQAPEGTTHVSVGLTCLSIGIFTLESGAQLTCSADEAESHQVQITEDFVLTDDRSAVGVVADGTWTAEVTFVNKIPTALGINEDDQSFGAEQNADGDTPDLVAVYATNGKQGYSYASDLEDASGDPGSISSPQEAIKSQEARRGKFFEVAVYESDGQTVIGKHIIPGPPKLADDD